MSTRRFYIHMNIAGFMRQNHFPRDYAGVFRSDDGTELTPSEAHAFLLGEVAKGRTVIPCSSECRNPCSHAAQGCTGFDYRGGGCPGYAVETSDADPGDEHQPRRMAA